jgi:hypothetical protein
VNGIVYGSRELPDRHIEENLLEICWRNILQDVGWLLRIIIEVIREIQSVRGISSEEEQLSRLREVLSSGAITPPRSPRAQPNRRLVPMRINRSTYHEIARLTPILRQASEGAMPKLRSFDNPRAELGEVFSELGKIQNAGAYDLAALLEPLVDARLVAGNNVSDEEAIVLEAAHLASLKTEEQWPSSLMRERRPAQKKRRR